MVRLLPCCALAALAALAAACTDFATPAELTKPTILAVVADPPVVRPGEAATLTTIVVDADGVLAGLPTRHALIETYPGVAPMGALADDGGTVRYLAPDPVPTLPQGAPPLDSVQVEVDTADGTLLALKVMAVLPTTAANPTLARLTVGDADALAGPVTLPRGATVTLEVATEPAAGDDARYAWYASAGAIEYYQSTPTELVVRDQPGPAMIYVVVRDGQGGVAWRAVAVEVQ